MNIVRRLELSISKQFMNNVKTKVAGLIGGAAIAAFVGVAAFSAQAEAYTFAKNLKVGSRGADVMNLQKILNSNSATQVSQTGAGSPGNETTYFGNATKAAVIKFQEIYASDILAPVGLTKGTGFVGASTRAKLSVTSVGTGSTTGTTGGTTTGGTTTPTAGGLSVAGATQPANGLAVQSASRVPFTKVTLTAGSSDVSVTGVTVERTGQAVDAIFSGVVLLDEDGTQLGIAKTLNSNHQSTVGDTFTVKAGTSKTVTIAGNMGSSLSSYAGQVASLSVVGVNTAATVSGSMPITGAMHTVNASLTIGTATLAVSSFDPNSRPSKEIGTTGFKFAGIRVTAGSAEQIRLKSVRFNQSGSVGSSDLSNVKVYVDGTAYDTTVSTDGKYYSANLGSGIVLDKGLSKDLYVQGDISGSGSSGRTVKFDIYKSTDIYLTGETYGYGVTATAGSTSAAAVATSEFTTSTPFFDGSTVDISAGSVTTVTKASSVAAQNVAVNVPNQVLGGYEIDLKGEAISVQQTIVTIATSSTGAGLITNASIYDENGKVVAGPVDASGTGTTLTFTDTITYPVGKHTFTIKGKLPSTFTNGGTVTLSTTPSSQWTSVTGQTTGNTISMTTLSTAATMNAMTVKAASLAIAVSTTPSAQTIVAGGQQVLFSNVQLDASQSGEDVRFSSMSLTNGGTATGLTSCQLFDGTTALNTGSNVVNPDAATEAFTFDQALTVTKGTVKTLALKCNVSASATGTQRWGITDAQIGAITVTGVTSSNSVTATGATATGQIMTIGSGSLTVSADASSPSYTVVAAGSTNVTVGVLKFRAANQAINLERVGLTLTNSASSSASDLIQVSLWDGSNKVGTATFVGSNTVATSTLTSVVNLPKDTDKTLTVKADFAQIGSSQPGTQGHLIAVDSNATTDSTGTRGTGVDSGTAINATGSTAFAGTRLFKSYPTLALDTLSGSGVSDGRLMRFKVTASSNGPVGLYKFTVNLATTSATVTNVNIFGYSDSSYSQGVSGVSTGGQLSAANVAPGTSGLVEVIAQTSDSTATTVQVPSGETRYFEVRGTVTGTETTYSVTATLAGDSAFPGSQVTTGLGGTGFMASTTGIDTDTNDDFIWSPNATTTSGTTADDWTNGYGLAGLPSNGLIQTRSN